MEFGNRQGNLRFVARFMSGSDEITKLKAQATGTAAIHLQYDADNALDIITAVAKTAVDGICQ